MELTLQHIDLLNALHIQVSDTPPGVSAIAFSRGDCIGLAHLMQRGFVGFSNKPYNHYFITPEGENELERLRNPTDPAETLRAEIAALERQLADKRAALAALEPNDRPSSEG